jgi:phosphoribosyl 1,2-cyclic phosphodiesterase
MKVYILGSGSKGNSTLIVGNNKKILIDVGFSYPKMKMLLEGFGVNPSEIDMILITHDHSDHIGGLSQFLKKNSIKVCANEVLAGQLLRIVNEDDILIVENEFDIDDFHIESFKTSHDAVGSVGYIITEDDKTVVYVTDTGYINNRNLKKLVNKDLYIFESNHDVEMLMNGPYPYILKQRVLSDKGHLSNELSGTYLKELIGDKTKKIVLAHLSEINNTPEVALKTVKEIVDNKDIEIINAFQDEPIDVGEV